MDRSNSTRDQTITMWRAVDHSKNAFVAPPTPTQSAAARTVSVIRYDQTSGCGKSAPEKE
jgi:hypothetical protein